MIFFQGDEDPVVPPNQTEAMVEALRHRGIPVGYFLFSGEQHGFRKAANIQRALDAELYFYALEVFGTGLRFQIARKSAAASKMLREQRPQHLDLAYGNGERNKWDLYPASDP